MWASLLQSEGCVGREGLKCMSEGQCRSFVPALPRPVEFNLLGLGSPLRLLKVLNPLPRDRSTWTHSVRAASDPSGHQHFFPPC